MSAAGFPFVLVPVAALALLSVALRPRVVDTVAPRRLALVRATVAVGAFAVATVEVLGALRLLTAPAFGLAWLLFLAVAALAAAWRRRVDARIREQDATGRLATVAVGGPTSQSLPGTVRADTPEPTTGVLGEASGERPPRRSLWGRIVRRHLPLRTPPRPAAGAASQAISGVRRVGASGCSPVRSPGCSWSSC
ncbi:hypothetical protein GCM10029963_48330 [Micromonospora andamanensis]